MKISVKIFIVFLLSLNFLFFNEVFTSANTLTVEVGVKTIDGEDPTYDSVGEPFYFYASSPYGITKMEYKIHDMTNWLPYEEGYVFPEDSFNSKYSFRAYDSVGNVNECHIYYDNTKPFGTIYTYNEILPNGSIIEDDFFMFEASDNLAGVMGSYVKTPNSNTYEPYDNFTYLYESGTYYFYVVDFAGNVSNTYYVTLNPVPMVDIIYNESNNTVYLTWEKTDYLVYVNDEEYIKETIFFEEKEYKITVIDKNGRIGEEIFVIDHLYKFINSYMCSCDKDGYNLYRCITCNDEYTVITSKKTGHNLIEQERELTCVQDGGLFLVCSKCDYYEEVDVIKASGHDYTSRIINNATCTEIGLREFTCSKCLDSYLVEIDVLNHNYILIDEKIKKEGDITVKELIYKCHNCLNTFSEYKNINNNDKEKISFTINNNLKYIIIILTVLSGFWSVYMGVKFITAKNKNEKVEAKKYIINYIIGLVVIFIIILAIPLLIQGISSIL